ncbi:MAG: hypothetical protein MK515_05230 [SAR324 cluster bacterium]|jgi:hypothetical protein|nr:hypothetical protein [SAR324 cluster bacterium]
MIVLLPLFFVAFSVVDIAAQNFDDDPLMLDGGDEFGFEQFGDDDFQSSDFGLDGLQGFGTQPGQDPVDSQFDSDGEYLDEGSFSDETESTLKDDLLVRREILSKEGKDAPSNLGYGAGTGLMMGTWFAFIRKETNTRQQFRTIGTSTVLGALIGIMLGTRSVWNPGAPRPDESPDPTGFLHTPAGWLFAQYGDELKIAYRWKF